MKTLANVSTKKTLPALFALILASGSAFCSEAEENKAVYNEINDVLTVAEAQGRFDWLEKCYSGVLLEVWEKSHDSTQFIKDREKIAQLKALWLSDNKIANKKVNYLSFANADFTNPYNWYPENSGNALCTNMPPEYEPVALQTTQLNRKYCSNASSDSALEWINSVSVNDQIHHSKGANYSFISGKVFNLFRKKDTTIKVTATTDQPDVWPAVMGVRTWIDFNHNGLFEESEMIHQEYIEDDTEFTFEVPDSAITGLTLMRVAGDANGGFDDACKNIEYGEVEDYLVNIQ